MVMDPVKEFHKLYYNSLVWDKNTKWRGVRVQKCPLDLWVYQEIIYETRPDLIIETGTFKGGTTIFLASVCEMIGNGKIVSIDIDNGRTPRLPYHDRINYLEGNSITDLVLEEVKKRVSEVNKVMVILDSDHFYNHVLLELEEYSDFVSVGSYLIVEDTNLNDHPIVPEFGKGSWEAVRDFLRMDTRFEVDFSREKFLMTFNPGGYLRRVR